MTLADSAPLANLARIGKLKVEPADARECAGLLRSASVRLRDAHGYRSENRYLVFQCLEHTLGFTPNQRLLLDQAHKKRNLAEYEGDLDVTASFVDELVDLVDVLVSAAQALDVNSRRGVPGVTPGAPNE